MELKERLHRVLVHHPMSIADLARQLKFTPHLLARFMKEANYPIQMRSKLLIEKWVQEKEKELQ